MCLIQAFQGKFLRGSGRVPPGLARRGRLRSDDPRRQNERISKPGLAFLKPAKHFHAHDTTGQSVICHACMIQIAAEDDRPIECTPVLVFEDLHRAWGFCGANHDFIIARAELVEKPLWNAKTPISGPTPELLPVVKRDRIFIAVIVVKVTPEFFEAHRAGKALRKCNHSYRMCSAVINSAAVFEDFCLLDVPRGWYDPSVMLAGTWHGDCAKWQYFAQIINGLVVTVRTNGPVERSKIPQDLHHCLHVGVLAGQIIGVDARQRQSIVNIQIGHAGFYGKSQPALTAPQQLEE